jgi:hypothetical protein
MDRWRRHVWSEFLSCDELCQPWLMSELRDRALQLVAAVTPGTAATASRLVATYRAHGAGIALWPMLEDSRGRWASALNAAAYGEFVRRLIDELLGAGTLPDELFVDLEPPIAITNRLTRAAPAALLELWRAPRDAAALACLWRELATAGVRLSAAVLPVLALDQRAARGWQHLLGTPVEAEQCTRLSVMAYPSLFEGYSGGLLDRNDARGALLLLATRARAALGSRAAVSLGVIAPGALGDERPYRGPEELREDVALVAHCGITDIGLYDLGGALRRPPLGAWLDALVAPAAPARLTASWRARALLAACTGLGWALAAAGAARRVPDPRLAGRAP